MEIKQLEYVIMAAEMGSFNRASEFLYTTQSNVSKVVRNLENELGYKIFKRNGGGVILTDAGRVLYEQAQQIMMMLNKFDTFAELSEKTCLHVASVSSNYVARKFARFVAGHDNHHSCLKMWEGSLSRVVELVEHGEAELGFVYTGENQRDSFESWLDRKGLYYKRLLPAEAVICVGEKNPYYHAAEITGEEMQALKYVRYSEDTLSRFYHLQQMEKLLHLENVMAHSVEVNSNYALINILYETDYAHFCYGGLVGESIFGIRGIRSIPVRYEGEQSSLGYVHRKTEPLSDYAREYLRGFAG